MDLLFKNKALYDNQHAKERKKKYRLAIEAKRKNMGVQEGVPLSAAETNLPKA